VMILLKCLVLSPVDEVCVLGRGQDVSGESEMWQKKKRKERKKEQALRPIHKVVYLVASLSLKALHEAGIASVTLDVSFKIRQR